jgi:hypothetical protein
LTTQTDVFDSLKTVIEAGVSGLRVYPRVPSSVNELPAAIIVPVNRDAVITMGGTLSMQTVRISVYVASVDNEQAWETAQNYQGATGSVSIQAAIDSNPTLGGAVDCALIRTTEIVQREAFGAGDYVVAEFTVEIWR